jgi:hypothetical protein
MPKPSSANKNPVPVDTDAAAVSVTKNSPARGSRASSNAPAAIVPAEKDLTSEKASRNCDCGSGCSTNSSAASEPPPITLDVTVASSTGPRVSIGTALCEAGFDERAVARQYVNVVQNLAQPNSTDRSGATKLLVDVLKECSRQLDSTGGHRAGDGPVVVRLVHTVSRPDRSAPALTSANPSPPIDIDPEPAAYPSSDTELTNPTTEQS